MLLPRHSLLAMAVGIAVGLSGCRHSVTVAKTNPDGWTVIATWVDNTWVGEREYRPNGTISQYRYWDYLHQLHVITYDEDGRTEDHSIRE